MNFVEKTMQHYSRLFVTRVVIDNYRTYCNKSMYTGRNKLAQTFTDDKLSGYKWLLLFLDDNRNRPNHHDNRMDLF